MKNKELFLEEVDAGSEIRYEINEDHASVLSSLYKIYKFAFNRNPAEFRYAKDILYYKGGYPSENTPPKAQSLANYIANAHMILSFLDKDEDLNHYLKERGLKIEKISEDTFYTDSLLEDMDYTLDTKREKKLQENWEDVFGDLIIPTNPKEILQMMMDVALTKQGVICEKADMIRKDKGEHIKEECDVKVSDYVKSVNLQYKVMKGEDVTETVDKIKEDATATIESITAFDEK